MLQLLLPIHPLPSPGSDTSDLLSLFLVATHIGMEDSELDDSDSSGDEEDEDIDEHGFLNYSKHAY